MNQGSACHARNPTFGATALRLQIVSHHPPLFMHTTASAEPSRSPSLDVLAISLVILAGVVSALHVGKAPIAVPELQQDFGRTLAGLSWVMSVFPFVGLLGLIAGLLVQSRGDRRMLVLGLLVLGVSSMAGIALPRYDWLIATRIVEGLGFLLIVVSAPSVLNRLVIGGRRSVIFGIWSCFMSAGIAVSMLLGPQLGNWHALWIVDGALAIVMALCVVLRVSPAPPPPRRPGTQANAPTVGDDIRSVLTTRASVLLALGFGVYNLQFFAFMSFMPSFLMERVGLTLAQAGVAAATIIASNMIGNLAAGVCLQRGVKPGVLMALTFVTTGVIGALIYLPGTPAAALIPLSFLFSSLAGFIPATIITTAPRAVPRAELAPIGLGLMMQGNYLGQVSGPILLGALMGLFGWTSAGMQIAAAGMAGVFIGLAFEGARRRAAVDF